MLSRDLVGPTSSVEGCIFISGNYSAGPSKRLSDLHDKGLLEVRIGDVGYPKQGDSSVVISANATHVSHGRMKRNFPDPHYLAKTDLVISEFVSLVLVPGTTAQRIPSRRALSIVLCEAQSWFIPPGHIAKLVSFMGGRHHLRGRAAARSSCRLSH